MGNVRLPDALPDCELIRQLTEKASQRTDTGFDFIAQLNAFRDRVGAEVSHINLLFPEYTPHDERYHLKRLFHVADTVLGPGLLEAMNSTELFILGVGLYGHDWGMAVSEAEKRFIITGSPPENTNRDDLWTLPDEGDRFARFCSDQHFPDGDDPSIDVWREYVRTTHAVRSGERARRFFLPIDGGVADAAQRVCEGHWLGFEDLQDFSLFPPDFACLRETINLRALAIYVRLIDLLDFAEDRTPYVIWKFVAPRDPHSRMEWTKHRALRAVTCPPYQEGRVIRVDGSTDDHEVHAALEDLHAYVATQFRGCCDLLARMNDDRHKLDLYHIDWRVAARGFKRISIQFEFDRERMFEILGDEIYQGDPYVFLRELLQNSIDAIRMRREILRRRGVEPGETGVIRVTIEDRGNGDAVITWSDDGIGMDEHTVRNYLAIAGKSYYQSSEFQREGLELDPISRFGVGILSCFMVATRVEIETYRDPYFPPAADPLRIIVPDVRRRFRIEPRTPESAQVGTTVRVFVEGNKLPRDKHKPSPTPLRVTDYLTDLPGFVEFPIVITEGAVRTVILHPRDDPASAKRFGEGLTVRQLDLSYPWEDAFLPQDLSAARAAYVEHAFDLHAEPSLAGYDGAVSFVVPASSDPPMLSEPAGPAAQGSPGQLLPGQRAGRPRLTGSWRADRFSFHAPEAISPSVRRLPPILVYRDGIFVSSVRVPRLLERSGRDPETPLPRYAVNLPKSDSSEIALSRTQFAARAQRWDAPIWDAYLGHIERNVLPEILGLDPALRLYRLAWLSAYYRIRPSDLWRLVPSDQWPLGFVTAEGRIEALQRGDYREQTVYVLPELLWELVPAAAYSIWASPTSKAPPLLSWVGERALISALRWPAGEGDVVMDRMGQLGAQWVAQEFERIGFRFVESLWVGDPPTPQPIYRLQTRKPEHARDVELFEKAVEAPQSLSWAELNDLRGHGSPLPECGPFLAPFHRRCGYGRHLWNRQHPFVCTWIVLLGRLLLAQRRRTIAASRIGELKDATTAVAGLILYRDSWTAFLPAVQRVLTLAVSAALLAPNEARDAVPSFEDFVPGSFGPAPDQPSENTYDRLRAVKDPNPKFGKPIA